MSRFGAPQPSGRHRMVEIGRARSRWVEVSCLDGLDASASAALGSPPRSPQWSPPPPSHLSLAIPLPPRPHYLRRRRLRPADAASGVPFLSSAPRPRCLRRRRLLPLPSLSGPHPRRLLPLPSRSHPSPLPCCLCRVRNFLSGPLGLLRPCPPPPPNLCRSGSFLRRGHPVRPPRMRCFASSLRSGPEAVMQRIRLYLPYHECFTTRYLAR